MEHAVIVDWHGPIPDDPNFHTGISQTLKGSGIYFFSGWITRKLPLLPRLEKPKILYVGQTTAQKFEQRIDQHKKKHTGLKDNANISERKT